MISPKKVDITAKVINIEIFSTRSSKEISFIKTHIYGLIIDPQRDQVPVGLIAQLVEHCASIAVVLLRVQAPIFQVFLSLLLKCHDITAKIINLVNVPICNSNEILLIKRQRKKQSKTTFKMLYNVIATSFGLETTTTFQSLFSQ